MSELTNKELREESLSCQYVITVEKDSVRKYIARSCYGYKRTVLITQARRFERLEQVIKYLEYNPYLVKPEVRRIEVSMKLI